jgi:hypothetical protein
MAAVTTLLISCGGGGATAAPEVVGIVVAGMPDTPLALMQAVQLSASATYSDGSAKDVTALAAWDSTDRTVLTVSASALVTAAGPGKAAVSATFGGVTNYASAEVAAPPAAYFVGNVEYAFDYELDAQGRVANYRISQREGIVYPVAPAGDSNVRECTGSLYGSYRCTGWYSWMSGEGGHLVNVGGSIVDTSTNYSYEQVGLAEVKEHWYASPTLWRESTSTLSYDEAGRLREVKTAARIENQGAPLDPDATATIELDSQGRLLRADVVTCISWYGCYAASSTRWTYDLAGFMTSAGTTTYTADADGWLANRQDGGILDAYAITRSGGRVAEEQFTQAYPGLFYGLSRPQRVRYQLGRLPIEPLFVPRALTGLRGADYFGIISSHHR